MPSTPLNQGVKPPTQPILFIAWHGFTLRAVQANNLISELPTQTHHMYYLAHSCKSGRAFRVGPRFRLKFVKMFQQLLSSKLDSANSPADPKVAWCTTCDVIMSSALEAYGHRSKAQPDWFRDNVDLVRSVAAKRSARWKVTARNNRPADRELQAAKRTVSVQAQHLTRFAVSRYWENLSTRIQQCADCGDVHGLSCGISRFFKAF